MNKTLDKSRKPAKTSAKAGATVSEKTAAKALVLEKKPVAEKKPAAEKAPAPKGGMSKIDSDLVRQLAAVLDETALSEIEYETGGLRIRVARGTREVAGVAYAPAAAAPATAAAIAASDKPVDPAHHPGAVKAPMVGVAYLLPEPGAPPFIKVGDQVNEGQTMLLIEAMKTFNPVKAPRSGKISAILIENGSPVEYGEPLAIIE